jgi:hypothetical protein
LTLDVINAAIAGGQPYVERMEAIRAARRDLEEARKAQRLEMAALEAGKASLSAEVEKHRLAIDEREAALEQREAAMLAAVERCDIRAQAVVDAEVAAEIVRKELEAREVSVRSREDQTEAKVVAHIRAAVEAYRNG